MARVLETILVGRDQLSPVYAKAAASTRAYEQAVTGSAAKQEAAAARASTANVAAANTASSSSVRSAVAAEAGARTQQTASSQVIAANSRTAESATASSATQSRAHARAAESATVSARAQQAANNALSTSNGLLGTSLTPLTAGLGAMALGLGYAAFRGMQFDSAMSQVQAATMATSGTMDQLRQSAIDLGADTQFSSEEAAQGITELAKAGVETSDILNGGLSGALDLAAAGQLSVADAAEIAATQMVVFNLQGNQMAHVADLLAAGAGKAQGSVEDMALALQYAGLPAAGLGLTIEETTGVLGLFASNGLVGEKAGTSFRGMLVSLTNPAGKAREEMERLNLQFFDAQGNFIGMDGVAGQLQTRLAGLTVEERNAALATLFGNEALGAAQALYNAGADGVVQWTNNVNDAGFAAEQAAKLNDNLRGDLEKMGGAFDSAMTSVGSGSQGPLRLLVQTLTTLIDTGGDFIGFIQSIPGPLQATAIAFAAIYIAAGPLGSLFPTIAGNARILFATVQQQAVLSGGAMGLFTGTVAAARVAIAGLLTTLAPFAVIAAAVGAISRLVEVSNAADDARDHIDELTQAYDDGQGAERYDALAGSLDQVRGAARDARDRLNELNNMSSWDAFWTWDHAGDIDIATEQLQAAEEAMAELDAASGRADTSIGVLSRRYGATRPQVEEFARAHGIDLSGSLQIVQGDFIRVADAAGGIEGALNQASTGIAFIGDTATMTQDQIDDAIQRLQDWRDELQDFATSFFGPLEAYKDLLAQKEEAERDSAQATADATDDSSDSWEDYVQDVTVSLDELAAQLEQQIANQEQWRSNLVVVTQRGGLEVGQALAAMGAEGADLTAAMATATEEDFVRMADALRTQAQLGGQDAVAALDTQMRVMAEVGSQGATATAQSIATALGLGVDEVAAIASQYGVTLAGGINPLLQALGNPAVQVQRIFGFGSANGNLVDYYANGGMTENHVAQIAPAGSWRVWAEPETGGESYIPLAPAKRERSMDIWRETGRRLNAPEAAFFANGGFASAADVPRISSTAPFRSPLSTAADAAMNKGRATVLAWLATNAESTMGATEGGPAGGSAIGGGWQAIAKVVQAAIPQARINSTYRPGDPGYHGRGKAVDFGFGSGPGGAGSAGLAKIAAFLYSGYGRTLAELIYDGLYDSSPDVKNGRDHTYNAGIRAEHRNHVHAAVYANGGLVEPGGLLNPHIRDAGGPLLPGYTLNATGGPEVVLPMAPAAQRGYGTTTPQPINVHFYVDGQEFRGMTRTEIDGALQRLSDSYHNAGG